MVDIFVKNNVCELQGPNRELVRLYEAFKVRHPGAFHLRRYMPKGWDGKIDFISPTGKFKSGLLQNVVNKCKELGFEVDVIEDRETDIKLNRKVKLGNLRDYQAEALTSITTNKIMKVRMPRGTIKVATNGGKTYISAAIHNHYKSKTIFLMNSQELYVDARRDMPELINGSIGWIDSKSIVWGDFMICMVATVRNRLPQIKHLLADYRVLVVDEHDMADNKTNKSVIENLFNTIVRIGLSGTGNVSKLAKDKPKNMRLEGLFGPQLYEVTNRELIDRGVSSEVEVTFIWGNKEGDPKQTYGSWMEDMDEMIVKNSKRNKIVLNRSIFHHSEGRKIQLIVAQRKKHIIRLYKRFIKHYGDSVKIDWVHSARKDRLKVTKAFMDGHIDILIGSMIIKRGKNFKKMEYMLNAGGGKSPENILQLLGRAFRGCKHYEDMLDRGKYLAPHSRKRFIYYKNEKIKVNLPDGVKSIHTFNK